MNIEPIKICFISPKAYPLFNPDIKTVFGGAEVDLYYIATELAKDKNFDVRFIVADYGQPQSESIENITVIKSLKFTQYPLISAIKIWNAMKKADAQMYMIKTVSGGTFLAALYCKLKKNKFIYRSAHTNDCDGTYLKKHFWPGKVFGWSVRSAAIAFVQNKTDQKNIKNTLRVDSIVIPNAHRLPHLPEEQRDIILWVSRSDDFKRPYLFLDLVKKYPDQKFVMICQKAINDKDYQALVDSAKTLNNLDFIKQVSFDRIDSYFRKAKLFVNTSDSEGFPNTFIQACKAATPILSLCVNPDDFLHRFNCGICADGDWDKFTRSLKEILQPENFTRYSNNTRKYVEDKHDISRIVEQYKEIFRTLSVETKK